LKKIDEIMINLQCELVAERNLTNPNDISWLQYDILSLLARQTNLLPSELCLRLGVSRVKLAKSLKKLKQLSYIDQQRSARDGRELQTQLTESGRHLLSNIYQSHRHITELAQRVMTEDEQKIFSVLADRLIEALKQRRLDYETLDSDR
jgi:MarR family transcriptional repressor of emrRAB